MTRLCFFVVTALISGLLLSPALAQSLEGKWLGSASPQAEVACWLNHRKPDGTYVVEFLVITPTGTIKQRDEGTWFLSNGLYATVTQRVDGVATDPSDRSFREIFKVVSLSSSEFVYADIGKDVQFTVTKVADGFSLGAQCPQRP